MPLIEWQIETNREREKMLHRDEILKELHHYAGTEQNTKLSHIKTNPVDNSAVHFFSNAILLQEAQGAFNQSELS